MDKSLFKVYLTMYYYFHIYSRILDFFYEMIKILRYEVSFFMIPLDTLYYVMYSIMHKEAIPWTHS